MPTYELIRPRDEPAASTINSDDVLIIDGASGVRTVNFSTTLYTQAELDAAQAVQDAATALVQTNLNTHSAAVDPHPQYTTDAEVIADIAAHVAESDPHTQYMLGADYDPDSDGIIAIHEGGTGSSNEAGARTNLGLGNSAVLDVGTITGTVCAGDDSRLSDARQCDNTFVDAATSRTNLGLGTLALETLSGTPLSGQVLVYDAAHDLWIPKTISGALNTSTVG